MPAPSNDNWANATVVSGTSGSQTGTNVSATTESGEPGHYNYSPFPNYPVARTIIGPFATVWYSWTCPTTGDYYFSTRDLSGANRTNYKSTIEAYTGSAVNSLTRVTYLLDQASGEGFGLSNFASIAFTAAAGTTYYIQVDGRAAGEEGNIYLTWGAYTSLRFGGCASCGPDLIPGEICVGTLNIADVTVDSVNSFGTFDLDPGNFKVRYCGGTVGLEVSQNNPTAGFLNYCGSVFSGSVPTMWNPTTTYSTADPVYVSCENLDWGLGSRSLNIPTGTNSVFDVTASAYWSVSETGACVDGLNTAPSPNNGAWSWVGMLPPSLSSEVIVNVEADCCPQEPGYDAAYSGIFCACLADGVNGRSSGYGTYLPSISSWAATDGSGYVGGNWTGYGVGVLGNIGTIYGTPAEAEAALACQDTGWFLNNAGEIGIVFMTLMDWTEGSESVCPTQYSIYQNTPKNPTVQLIHQPFTIAMLEADVEGCAPTNVSGNDWSFDFYIDNLSDVNWGQVTIELLNTGGISSGSTQTGITLDALATTQVTLTGTADTTSGLITATIQISRNGVVVGTIAYPLYPVFTIALVGAPASETICSGTAVYEQYFKLTAVSREQVYNLNQFHAAGGGNVVITASIDSGAVNVYANVGTCTLGGSVVFSDALVNFSGSTTYYEQYFAVRQADISAGSHTINFTVGFQTATGTTLTLFTQNLADTFA